MSTARRLRRFVVPALLLSVAAAPGRADASPAAPPTERPVVVTVSDDGFHWADAGLGAAAAFAATLLALGLVLALRPDRNA